MGKAVGQCMIWGCVVSYYAPLCFNWGNVGFSGMVIVLLVLMLLFLFC